ncbi:type IV pilus modification PilV family protein [Metabacillus schmidteae]|uniref:type IV pilus modification PilV family protein n=1 Tax=Metabacillus schmidteae TaxID=2730405 RepID=UPI00158C9FF3|nr:prepilin-type N-terminal cleavage/methylation domain-containing protein [Metabacillus schmidteae]
MKFNLVKLFSHNKGFTLIEVMLSIVIFSILTLGLLALFSQAMNYSQKSENDTLGVYAARNMLNYMEQQNFEEMKSKYVDGLSDEGQGSSIVLKVDVCEKWYSGSSEEMIKKKSICKYTFNPDLNNRTFSINVTLKKHSESDLSSSLIPMEIHVQWDDDNETTLEGFIKNEKLR